MTAQRAITDDDDGFGADDIHDLGLRNVSRETLERATLVLAHLGRWSQTHNLVGPSELPRLWRRHVLDSLQLLDCAPDRGRWVDLGSGAGFPGLILGCGLSGTKDRVELIEASSKRCAFLRSAARTADLPVTVTQKRIEQAEVIPSRYVTARALAPLHTLLDLALPWFCQGSTGVFLKGSDVESEIEQASREWRFNATLRPSLSDSRGAVLIVSEVERV